MNVLHIRNSSFHGGPEKLILSQARKLKEKINIGIAVIPDHGNNEFYVRSRNEGIKSYVLAPRLKGIYELRQIIKNERYGLICTHDYKSNLFGKLASIFLSLKHIAVMHGRTSHNIKMKIYEFFDNLLFLFMDAVVTVSNATASTMPCLNGRLTVIRNALDIESMDQKASIDFRNQYGFGPQDVVIGTAGRLSPEKGHKLLIDAFEKASNQNKRLYLLIAGGGRLERELQSEILDKNLQDRVHFLGQIQDMNSFYQAIDIFVLPSEREGLPMVLLESAFHEKSAISTDVGGVSEVIQSGVNGILVPSKNSTAMADAMIGLGGDEIKRKELGKASRENLLKNFTADVYAAQYLDLFRKLYGAKKVWITWEHHRRTVELSIALGISLKEFILAGRRTIKHPLLIFRTAGFLLTRRPDIVIIQCPSIVLGMLALGLKSILKYQLVSDCHNEAVIPSNYRCQWYQWMIRCIHRRSDMCIVTNEQLKKTVEKNGGKAMILPDNVPGWNLNNHEPDKRTDNNAIIFICTFSPDEPYREAFRAFRKVNPSYKVFVTGNHKKAEPQSLKDLSENVKLTGFLSEPDYIKLISEATVLMDLTLREDCLVCGAYEAVALGKPLITSDTKALRNYFYKGTVYSKPDARSLSDSINEAIMKRKELAQQMSELKDELKRSWNLQAEALLRQIKLMNDPNHHDRSDADHGY